MKKIISCMVLMFLTLSSAIIFVGCDLATGPYFKVVGLKTEYEVGESLHIGNAKIHYYETSTSKDYTEIKLTKEMISGFSTEQEGEFVMKITFKRATVNVTYYVGDVVPNPDDGNNPGDDQTPTAITEQQAESVLYNSFEKMNTYEEIQKIDNILDSFMNIQITRKTEMYYSSSFIGEEAEDENQSEQWTEYRNGTWNYYNKSLLIHNEDVIELYEKYTLDIDTNNMITYILEKNVLGDFGEFVSGSKTGNNYILKYSQEVELMGVVVIEIYIEDNKFTQMKSFVTLDETLEMIQSTSFEYFSTTTNAIPQIPNVSWIDGGEYDLIRDEGWIGDFDDGEYVGDLETLTEQDSNEILLEAIENMCGYAEIKQTVDGFYLSVIIAREDVLYECEYDFYGEIASQSWIVCEDEVWYIYEAGVDVFTDEMTYEKMEIMTDIEFENAIDYMIQRDIVKRIGEFVEGKHIEDSYVLSYNVINGSGTQDIIIKDGTINAINFVDEYEFICFSTKQLNSVPELPNVTWENGGWFIE